MNESDSPMAVAVRMEAVSRDVILADGASKRILHDISVSVEQGGLLHLVGPSGSGKSSLVRLINRLDGLSGGRIAVLGRPVEDWPPRQLRRRVAMVFQEPMLLNMTVEQNLQLPFVLNGPMPADLADRVAGALEMAGLDGSLAGRTADQLSVGQKQRVTLARALIGGPDMLLLDEPTSSLDPRTAEGLLERITAIRAERSLTVVMVTHRLAEARRLGGQLAVLIDGRMAACGPVEQVLADPPSEAVSRFLHGANHGAD